MKILTEPHWAIIQSHSVFVPGDQHSRDAPGHGYPEHYEETISYNAYTNIDQWRDRIEVLIRNGKSNGTDFLAVQVTPQIVHFKVEVTTKGALT
jgi:hypothetical protein